MMRTGLLSGNEDAHGVVHEMASKTILNQMALVAVGCPWPIFDIDQANVLRAVAEQAPAFIRITPRDGRQWNTLTVAPFFHATLTDAGRRFLTRNNYALRADGKAWINKDDAERVRQAILHGGAAKVVSELYT